jgi:hypothetical protein
MYARFNLLNKEMIESKREIKESDKKQPTLLLYMFDTFVMYNFSCERALRIGS